jgi:alpha(1,3/1,4) fucosyltransferase
MKVLFHNVYDHLNKNNLIFENDDTLIGDDLLKPFRVLAEKALENDITVGTYDKIPLEEADAVFFIDYPNKKDRIFEYFIDKDIPMFLITFESPIVKPEIFMTELHKPFIKVFTWSDKLVALNPAKYIKINFSSEFRADFNEDNKRPKNCVVIAGNKKSDAYGELYSERIKCIKWYNKYSPNNLDLYGFGWDLYAFNSENIVGRILNKVNRKVRFMKNNFSVYKGTVKRKYEILPLYDFSICLENVTGYDGWITEKIFDCFFSGTIPIYKGAPNVASHIPSNCFINYDDFASVTDLHNYLISMTDKEKRKIRNNIRLYILNDKFEQFSIDYLTKTILAEMLKLPNSV